jgi:hypothetical protein
MMIPMEKPGTGPTPVSEPVRRWWYVWLLWLAAIAVGLVAGVITSRQWRETGPAIPVALQADRQSGKLEIRWDPRSPTVSLARNAVITISSEAGSVHLACNRACLARGDIAYPWQGVSVDIGMRFTGESGVTTEEFTRHVVPAGSETPTPDMQ